MNTLSLSRATGRGLELARLRPGPATAAVALVLVALACIAGGLAVSGMIGTNGTEFLTVLEIAYRRAWGVEYVPQEHLIVSELRLPRGVLAVVVGAALGLVGCVLQAVVRNPLADSSVLGGTSGATLGAVTMIALAPGATLTAAIPTGAFLGAAGGFALSLGIAASRGSFSPLKLVLAGVAVSFVLSALTDFVIVRAGDERKLRTAVFWQLGSVADAQWHQIVLPGVVLALGIGYLLLRARRLDSLAFGDLTAHSLGVHPRRLRAELIVASALIVGVCVAAAGGIGFVSLVVPHACRLLVGTAHGRLLPASAAVGGAFLLWADIASRVVARPSELPLGVVTALIGGVVFAVLLGTRMKAAV